jgi:hypothetical protein
MPDENPTAPNEPKPSHIGALALWFAVGGGVIAWAIHLSVAWSVMEVSCLGPVGGSMLQQAGTTTTARVVAYVATAGPWLMAVAAFVTCLVLRARLGGLIGVDELAGERTRLLLVIGIFLDLMAVAAITGGAIGLVIVEPCA